eukprot:CAMPEP_0197467046 /NCGR_PEP_ID=MMETSP1175-20131217/65367_1 /TAXON_ID=1003142 /ORGANISM="Triceratium dubium, Strain CCMP147" /LENGTH=96 /DNA_ID=CAMNT_0043003107 /DNA_START=1589 /DNA_END=1880 /DNA_ORIENTATION=-
MLSKVLGASPTDILPRLCSSGSSQLLGLGLRLLKRGLGQREVNDTAPEGHRPKNDVGSTDEEDSPAAEIDEEAAEEKDIAVGPCPSKITSSEKGRL